MFSSRRLWPAATLAVLLIAFLPQAASGAGSFSKDETARSYSVDSASRKTKRFWTEERMLEAEKNDLDSETGAPDAPTDDSDDGAPPTTVDPERPELEVDDTYSSTTLRSGGSEIPYTREEIPSEGEFPYITHGRIFFRSGGISYSCSGTVITTENRSVVWTAGHCVNHGRDRWANKWIFVPGYDDGEAPYGKWTAEKLAAPKGWINYGSSAYDIGAAILKPNSEGEYIADVVGSLGIAWNLSRRQEYTVYGYPAAGIFDGGSLWACHSGYGWSDPIPGPNPMAVGCNLTYGSSGGGWVVELPDGLYLNSVTSYSHVGERHVMYGPYFGDAAASLYDLVSG